MEMGERDWEGKEIREGPSDDSKRLIRTGMGDGGGWERDPCGNHVRWAMPRGRVFNSSASTPAEVQIDAGCKRHAQKQTEPPSEDIPPPRPQLYSRIVALQAMLQITKG